MKSYPEQLHLFFNAWTFLTRLPSPSWVSYTEQTQAGSTKYLPWVGFVIGLITALTFWLFSLIFNDNIAILLSMLTSIWITGAFHEDGLADSCDGFGGGWDKERIITIMKDSRIGAFGVVGLIMILLLKFNAFIALQETFLTLVLGHSLSRFMPLLIIYSEIYTNDPNNSKSKDIARSLQKSELGFAAIPVLVCFLFLPFSYVSVILPTLLATLWMARYFRRWIDGYNGDCLGACQQVTELLIYLWLCLPWFIA